MPPRTAPRSMNTSVPPWTRGDFRGVFERGNKPTRRSATAVASVKASQAFTPSEGGDFQGSITLAQSPKRSWTVWVRRLVNGPKPFARTKAAPQ